MSKLLLVLAVLCFVSVAQADTTISQLLFSESACSTTPIANNTVTAGVCQTGSRTALYCSNDGKFIYQVAFSDSSCNSTSVLSITQTPTSCGWSSANLQYQCNNIGVGPALPWSFPTAGWVQTTSCTNVTNKYMPATVCSAVSGNDNIHCSLTASRDGVCTPTGKSNAPSRSSGCTASGDAATVYFSDANCGTMLGAITSPLGCYAGVSSVCGSNTVSLLPTIGFTQYDNDKCDAKANVRAPATFLFLDNQCLNSAKFTCSTVNGTQAGTYTTFADSTLQGTCPSDSSTTVVTQQVLQCINQKIFTCATAPTPGAASSTGASMVAMIVAAIVALIASLSL